MDLFILSIVNWLHLLATVLWIGGMMILPMVVMPILKTTVGPGPMFGKFMGAWGKKFTPLAFVCLIILIISGIVMMLYNKHYEGIGNITNLWSTIMLIKHIIVVLMLFIGIYLGVVVGRKIEKLMKGVESQKAPPPELSKLQNRQMNMAMTNLILGIIVLALTGISGAISAM